MSTVLEVRGVTVKFGPNVAVDDVDLSIDEGRIMGLIGPNGAGKTTLFNVIAGIQRPVTGRIVLSGQDITRKLPHRRSRLGISRTFQRLETFGTMSVRENVLVGAESRRDTTGRSSGTLTEELIERLGLGADADTRVDMLATGSQRLVEIGRALATQPRVILFDEASSGLSEFETESLSAMLRELADQGLTMVLVEHDMSFVMGLCDRVAMLDQGRLVAEGSPDEVRSTPIVMEAYLGTPAGAAS